MPLLELSQPFSAESIKFQKAHLFHSSQKIRRPNFLGIDVSWAYLTSMAKKKLSLLEVLRETAGDPAQKFFALLKQHISNLQHPRATAQELEYFINHLAAEAGLNPRNRQHAGIISAAMVHFNAMHSSEADGDPREYQQFASALRQKESTADDKIRELEAKEKAEREAAPFSQDFQARNYNMPRGRGF